MHILPIKGTPQSLLASPPTNMASIRDAMLNPLGLTLAGASSSSPVDSILPLVGIYPFTDGSIVLENFRNESVVVMARGLGDEAPMKVTLAGKESEKRLKCD